MADRTFTFGDLVMKDEVSEVYFPGFVLEQGWENEKHHIELGTLVEDNYVFDVIMKRAKSLRDLALPFFVSQVNFKLHKIWHFSDPERRTVALLAFVNGQNVIAVCTRGPHGKVERVIPFSDFIPGRPLADLRTLIDLKIDAAEYLEKGYVFSDKENELLDILEAEEREETKSLHILKVQQTETNPAQPSTSASSKKVAKQERLRELLSRPESKAWGADGQPRYGLTLFDDEWSSCPNGTRVIIVDQEGRPLEAFKVLKQKGKAPQKGSAEPVTAKPPSTTKATESRTSRLKIAQVIPEQGGERVQIYESFEQIRQARLAGLNGGTWVAADDRRESDGRFMVFEVHTKEIRTIGKRTLVL